MDRRQMKTRKAIFAAFEELMANQSYNSLTVAQIIDKADIGRSTFYAHFETKDDLLKTMCTEMFDHIFTGVDSHCVSHATLETPNLEGRLAHLLYHLRDQYGSICGKLLQEHEPHFTAFFRARLVTLFDRSNIVLPEGIPADLCNDIMVSGFCETVVWWFDGHADIDPQKVARWYTATLPVARA